MSWDYSLYVIPGLDPNGANLGSSRERFCHYRPVSPSYPDLIHCCPARCLLDLAHDVGSPHIPDVCDDLELRREQRRAPRPYRAVGNFEASSARPLRGTDPGPWRGWRVAPPGQQNPACGPAVRATVGGV